MNVMMIGHSGSGKTTYMAAMYGIMLEGIENYSIVSQTEEGHENLANICQEIFNGEYPKQTDIHSEYNFYLCYDEEGLIEFDWYDYRGGALAQRSDSSDDVKELEERIVNADALIVFLDGDKIIKSDNYSLREYRRISQCIHKAVSRIDDDYPYPISFIITKAGKHSDKNLYETPGFNAIMNIIELIQGSENIHGLLAVTEINKEVIYNVEYPFLFSMMFGVLSQRNKIIETHNACVEKANGHMENDTLWDRLESWWEGWDSEKVMAEKEIEKIQKLELIFEKLTTHLDEIQDMLKEAEKERIDLF